MIEKIKTKIFFFRELTRNKKFEEYYIIFNVLFCFLGWYYNQFLGFSLLILSIIFSLILTNDLRLSVSSLLLFLFTINKGFDADKIPIPFIVIIALTFIILIIYLFYNKPDFKKIKSIKGLIGLCIFTLIPILWYVPKNSNQVMFYFVYFTYFLYLTIYFIVVLGCKNESLGIFIKTFSYVCVLISFQVIITASKICFENENIFSIIYYLGWGMSNEAGIMICFSIPFLFILIRKSTSTKDKIYRLSLLCCTIPGIILTASRGAYLLFLATISSCTIFLLIKSKNKKRIIYIITAIMTITLLVFLLNAKKAIYYINKIISSVFEEGFNLNGRDELWKEAWTLFTHSFRNIIFGSGVVSIIRDTITPNGWAPAQVVFHSTLFQTLIMGGILGFVCLIIHLIEKYKAIAKLNKIEYGFILISFVLTDLYGLMDNTYHMFYYMIPLVILLACIDSDMYVLESNKNSDIGKNEEIIV